MAITTIQTPNHKDFGTVGQYPHAKTGTQITTFLSDKYTDYEDFMYYITIENNKTNREYNNLVPPLTTSGLSYYDVGQAVKSSVWYDYDPMITGITNEENYLTSYTVKYYEYYNQSIHLGSIVSNQLCVGNLYLNLFNVGEIDQVDMLEYQCNDIDKKFLTNLNKTLRLKVDDYASLKAFNMNQSSSITSPNIDNIKYDITTNNGSLIECYINNTYTKPNPSDSDLSDGVIQIPIGPKNIESIFINQITLPNGYVFTINATTTLNLDDIDYYYVYSRDSLNNRTSQKYKIDVYCDKDSNLISWENGLGGTDYFNFSKRDKKIIQTEQKTYEKSKYDFYNEPNLGNAKLYYGRTKKRGDTVFRNKYREVYTLYSPYLDTFELDYIENLFYSENVEMFIDGKWYACLNTKKKATIIQKGNTGLKQYKFEVEVDKNLILN